MENSEQYTRQIELFLNEELINKNDFSRFFYHANRKRKVVYYGTTISVFQFLLL